MFIRDGNYLRIPRTRKNATVGPGKFGIWADSDATSVAAASGTLSVLAGMLNRQRQNDASKD